MNQLSLIEIGSAEIGNNGYLMKSHAVKTNSYKIAYSVNYGS
jgi:hypothetical protein